MEGYTSAPVFFYAKATVLGKFFCEVFALWGLCGVSFESIPEMRFRKRVTATSNVFLWRTGNF